MFTKGCLPSEQKSAITMLLEGMRSIKVDLKKLCYILKCIAERGDGDKLLETLELIKPLSDSEQYLPGCC